MIGQTISHYHILEKLGEGGMGVVYKAHDTELDRDVALKFLPHHITVNEAEQARFLQEARAAAVLNHPNICTVHAIEKADDQQFIVMEYVEGKTLRQLIPTQKTQIAIDYAIQIGEALQEAHSKGIVHRDIKADNIMVNSKNQIKVMDFGLAKLKGSLKLTKTSSTVGTLAYMAPEQIQGGEVDARSDIFSFGVVLFEMLTGHLPFRGDHEAALVYSIVNEEPTPIQKYLPEVSSELVHIINRVLEKDPEERYQGIKEVLIDLRRLKKETTRVSRINHTGALTGHEDVERAPKSSSLKKIVIPVAACALIFGAIVAAFLWDTAPRLNPEMTIRVLDIPFSGIQYPGISPDGKWLVFPAADANGKWDLYNMHLPAGEPKRITNDSSGVGRASFSAHISPDGSLVTYALFNSNTNTMQVRVVSSLGGASRTVCQSGFTPKWRPDGQRIGYLHMPARGASGKREFWTVRPNGSDPKLEFGDSMVTPLANVSFCWSPDGGSIVWLRTFANATQEMYVRDLTTGSERQLTREGKNIDEVYWTSNDQIIYSTSKSGSTTLWMMPAAGGESVQITKEGPDMGMSVSADNRRMVFYRREVHKNLWRADANGSDPKQLIFDEPKVGIAHMSPDRRKIIYDAGQDAFGWGGGIVMMDRDGTNKRQIVPGSDEAFGSLWSPDGRWITYNSQTSDIPLDSSRILILDANTLTTPVEVARGVVLRWGDKQHLFFARASRTWQVDIATRIVTPFFEESTYALPVAGNRYIWYRDRRARSQGFWIIPANYKKAGSEKPRLMLSYNEPLRHALSEDLSMAIVWDDEGSISKMLLPSGKRERLPKKLPGLNLLSDLTTSRDGKELLYVERRIDAKLILIEDLFR